MKRLTIILISLMLAQVIAAQCPTSGNADLVVSQTGVDNPGAVTGGPDGISAQLYDQGDQLVVYLTDEIPAGESYTLRWRRDPGTDYDPNIAVEESFDGSSWSAAVGSPFGFSNTAYFDQSITAGSSARYLRFTTQNVYNVDIDAVSYSIPCAGAATFSCADSLIANAEFESGASGWNTYGSLEITTDSYFGSQAILFTDASGAGADQTIAAVKDRIYTMEGYARVNGQAYTNAILKFYDSDMNEIAYYDAVIESDSYGYFSLSGMAPKETKWIRPSLWKPAGGGTAAFDGICVSSYIGNKAGCSGGCPLDPSFSDYVWSLENEQSGSTWMDYDNGNLSFCEADNGIFRIEGTIIGGIDADWGAGEAIPCGAQDAWEVNLVVHDRQGWSDFGGSYVQNAGCAANHIDWDYWDISGSLLGIGCNAGRVISNLRSVDGYRLQIGLGGNSQSCNFGLSTWMQGEENGTTVDLDLYAHIDQACYESILQCHVGITKEHPTSCGGNEGEITLDIMGGTGTYDYSWSNGLASGSGTGNTITGLGEGVYRVEITDDGTCSDTILTMLVDPENCNDGTTRCLGQASNFALLGLNGGEVIVNSAKNIYGDIGYSSGVISTTNQKAGDDGVFMGTSYVHSSITSFSYQPFNYLPSGGIIQYDPAVDDILDQANTDAVATSAEFAMRTVTAYLGALNDGDDRTVNRTGGVTVVEITSLDYNDDQLTLVGLEGADDAFIINVLGDFEFSCSSIELVNVRPEKVVFNFPNASQIFINKDCAAFNGTILAPLGSVEYHNTAEFNGAIIALNINVHSDFNLFYRPLEIACPNAAMCDYYESISPLWVVDEGGSGTDGMFFWYYEDYSDPANSAVELGRLKYYHPVLATVRDVFDADDMESMAVNIYTGQAYFMSKFDAYNGPGNGNQALWTYNLNDAAANQGNIVLELIGHINKPSGVYMEGLAFDPNSNRLYTADPVDGTGDENADEYTDVLYYVDLASLHSDPMQVTNPVMIGSIEGLGQTNNYVDAMEFSEDGKLYVIDGTDDDLYEISPSTGAIIDIVDTDLAGGTGDSYVDIESLSWDAVNNILMGIDNDGWHQNFVHINLAADGNNSVIANYASTPGLPDVADFEGSAMYAACINSQVSIGNLIFEDANGNGVYDDGEGLDNITVQLYLPGQDPSTAIPVAEQETKSGGFYRFRNLTPGTYFIHIPADEFASGGTLEYYRSMDGAGGDDQIDDNFDENGLDAVDPSLTGVSSALITLSLGNEAIDALSESGAGIAMDNKADANGDMTIDFGFVATCDAPWNTPVVTADFSPNHLSVEVFSTQPIQNVVLEFHDGDHEMFNNLSGFSGVFAGTGVNEDKCVTGVWIRSECNPSGDGPEYGEFNENYYWDGFCISDGPPVINPSFEHESTVVTNGPPTVDPPNVPQVITEFIEVNNNGGHNSTATGIGRPDIPPGHNGAGNGNGNGHDNHDDDGYQGWGHGHGIQPGRSMELELEDLHVFPNPVRASAYLNIRGLHEEGQWHVHIYNISGSYIASRPINSAQEIDLDRLDLKPGMYFLHIENGRSERSAKIVVQ